MAGISFSQSTFSDLGGAVSDLFQAEGDNAKVQNYDLAAQQADQNAQFTELSTSIKNMQESRKTYQTIGGQQADVAASGFSSGGSAGDLLRESASQGALTHAVTSEQGLITEQGYEEQAASYTNMAKAASEASTGSIIGSVLKGAAAVASVFAAPLTGGLSLAATAGLDGLSAIH
jgi:hypothetical protein